MHILELILDRRKNIIGKSKDPMDIFLEKWGNALELIDAINKNIKSNKLIQEARRNYVINIVTGFEVFLKDTFVETINNHPELDTKQLVKKKVKKFSLDEVELIIKKNISKGEIIAEYINFQNLSDIETSYSLLFNFNFFEEFKKYKWYYDEEDPNGFMQINDDFYPNIKEIIQLRHNFVHDINFKKKLSMGEINEFHNEIIFFISLFGFFIEDFFS